MNDLPELTTAHLRLVHARPEHAAAHAAFMARNREHFLHWEPPRSTGVETTAYWVRQLAQAVEDFHSDGSVRLALFPLAEPARLVGRVNFTQIYRGPYQSCVLGYMFNVRRLHRIEANHRPENDRSARLLARLGFVAEGYARAYLFIDGQWRDHVRTAKINTAFDTTAFDAGT
jgi:ribosomal-protein-alanine N-acetyltransferase